MKVGAIIQARMGSTRLPGKVMKELGNQTVLAHVIERAGQSKIIDEIIVATTVLEHDNVIEEAALNENVQVFRGSEEDVLSRFYLAAKKNKLDVIIRISSDCPLIDPFVLDSLIKFYLDHSYDIVSNAGNDIHSRTFPRGLDAEVFSFETLRKAYEYAKKTYQREHVTPYIYEESKKVYYYKNPVDYSEYRWTLDTEDDFKLIEKIYKHLYKGTHNFYTEDVINLFEKNPKLSTINSHIEQKKIK